MTAVQAHRPATGSAARQQKPRMPDGSPPRPTHPLLAAHRHITRDLVRTAMPLRIVEAACELVGAPCGGFAVLGPHGEVADCAHTGMTTDLLTELQALVSSGPGSSATRHEQLAELGFASIPIVVRGEPYGELHVRIADASATAETWSADGDDRIGTGRARLEAFGAMAGTALETALLYEEAARSKDWLHASGEIARALLADQDGDMLFEVVRRALHVAEADAVSLLLPKDDLLEVAVTAGLGEAEGQGRTLDPAVSPLAREVLLGHSLLVSDIRTVCSPHFVNEHGFGPVMVAPLVDAHGVRGAVCLFRIAQRAAFSASDLDLVTTFADQIALALEMADARLRAQRLGVLEVRHRIAQDLHDNVMQRLFATGMGLQSLAGSGLPPALAVRLNRYIAELDETIDDIRTRVFDLRQGTQDALARVADPVPHVAREPEAPSASGIAPTTGVAKSQEHP